ncbi:hypothetical protein B7C42_08247 [Nocardia cerradoensis]|uniref:Uncharacterized protein n=1 Tax=Nocardia cerradoensis TaxID=85688 RepID=A0A231GSX5_9NOCA|nr:hypothetical protein B7C42_08247 [Nocardia cerradoensis]
MEFHAFLRPSFQTVLTRNRTGFAAASRRPSQIDLMPSIPSWNQPRTLSTPSWIFGNTVPVSQSTPLPSESFRSRQ